MEIVNSGHPRLATIQKTAPMISSTHHTLRNLFTLFVVTGLLGALSSRAQAPANDLCSGAQVLSGAGPFPIWSAVVDITEATLVGNPPDPATCQNGFNSDASRSVWYRFSPVQSGPYLISLCSEAPTLTTVEDTILAVYTSAGGCSGPFTEVAGGCNDDFCGPDGFQSAVILDLQAGSTYYLVVWQYDDLPPASGMSSVQVLIKPFFKPANDRCADAEEVFLNRPVRGATIGAIDDYQIVNFACYTGIGHTGSIADGGDVVYRFTAPTDGLYSFKTLDYSDLSDLVVYVASSCPGGTPPVSVLDCLGAANRNPVSTAESVVCLPLAASQEVFIFVDEDGLTGGSSFILEVTRCIPDAEPNNDPETANLIVSGLTGSLAAINDVDMFTLGVPPAGARVFAMLDAEAANLPDFDLRVTEVTNTLEFDDDDNDTFFGGTAPNVAGTPLPGGPAFLRVNFSGPAWVEPYRLYATVQPAITDATPEVEPNGQRVSAQTAANNYFVGSLAGPSPSQDADYYQFSAQAGDLIFVSLDADPLRDNTPINARMELQNDLGETLVMVSDSNETSITNRTTGTLGGFAPNSPSEGIIHRTSTGGVFFVRISIDPDGSGMKAEGDYLLSIAINCYVGSGGVNRPPMPGDFSSNAPVLPGETVTLSGSVADPDLSQFQTLTIDWGDGTGLTTVTNVGTGLPFAADHVYAGPPPGSDGSSYPVIVIAEDIDGGRGTNTTGIVVLRVQEARFLSVRYLEPSTVEMTLMGTPSELYEVWASSDFTNWSFVVSATAQLDGMFTITDNDQPKPAQRFYRAVAPAP